VHGSWPARDAKGSHFSPGVERAVSWRAGRFGTVLTASLATAVTILVASYGVRLYRQGAFHGSEQPQQAEALRQQNSALSGNLAQLKQTLEAQQREIQNLRAQLGIANKTAESLRQENKQTDQAGRTVNQSVQLPAELQNRDKQLAEARGEIERINQLRDYDEASLIAQQVRLAELSDQLRIASATLDMERQLTAAGKDIRELLTARQLHVIDVRDTDTNGKPSKAFGRVFVTEGKSLTFYAFDLNEERSADAKHRFEVWGSQQAKGSPARSLGFLYTDDKAQRRWALKLNDPQLIKEVDSVFVTLEPAGGTSTPSGKAMLYAYLGQPNHP